MSPPCCWGTSLGERRCFRGQRGLARPECAGLSSPPDMAAQGPSSLRHKAPLHILLYPGHCERPLPAGSGPKCTSCHWLLPVPVQLLDALRCSALHESQSEVNGRAGITLGRGGTTQAQSKHTASCESRIGGQFQKDAEVDFFSVKPFLSWKIVSK